SLDGFSRIYNPLHF
ncbi:hypothetical protein ACN38_g2670, partial [Penicillium nordicum]